MSVRGSKIWQQWTSLFVVMLAAFVCPASASTATLLLEEPYGKLGFFTPTGHAAVYLSDVCADGPTKLRHCHRGETGVVISRYNGVAGYDWLAIPLIPYLYAVEDVEDIPLFADPKLVSFLRDQYRRKYLMEIAPDKNGAMPGGNWYELVGTSYDRTVYGFEIPTTREQDDALIRKYNADPNISHFRTVSHNCADFTRDIINFYYPKALGRSYIADIGIATPKQMAKKLVKYAKRHPEVRLQRFVIPQVPGSLQRSFGVQGVVEAFLKSKKYIVPSAIASPIFAGCVGAVYVGTGGSRLNPAKGELLVFNPASKELETPLAHEDRRSYEEEFSQLIVEEHGKPSGQHLVKAWGHVQSRGRTDFDDEGGLALQIEIDEQIVNVGLSAGNVLTSGAPPKLIQQMLQARLQSELRRSAQPTASASDVARDWKLLQQAMELNNRDPQVATALLHREVDTQEPVMEQASAAQPTEASSSLELK